MERETAVRRKRVDDAETAIKQEQEDMRNAEKAGLMTTKPGTTFEEMLNPIGDSLSHLASSNNGEDGEDKDDDEEDPAGDKLSEDDKLGWVMGTISGTVQYRMECFRHKQMMLNEMTQLGWGDAANYFRARGKKHGPTELNVPAVIQPEMAYDAAPSVPTTYGEPIETLDSVPGKLQMPRVISLPGSSHMRQGSG